MRATLGLAVLCLALGARGVCAQRAYPEIHAMGFGDVSYHVSDASGASGFLLGQAVGHISVGLAERLSLFSELSATAREASFALSVERLILRYDVQDWLKLSLGRYHTPISYWNTAFHHGAWLQTTVARPEMVRFGSPLIPVHFLGMLAEGALPSGPLNLGYALGVGNGRAGNIAQPGDAGDLNAGRALLAGLRARPGSLPRLQLGGGAYFDVISSASAERIDERILTAHVAYERDIELLAEYAAVRHEPRGDVAESSRSHAGYVQLAYRLPSIAQAWKPYLRVERVSIGDGDPVLPDLQRDYRAWIAGLRFDLAPFAALKAEYRDERVPGSAAAHSLVLQASFAVVRLAEGPPIGAAGTGDSARLRSRRESERR